MDGTTTAELLVYSHSFATYFLLTFLEATLKLLPQVCLQNKTNDSLNHSHKSPCYFQIVFLIDYLT